MVGLEHMSKGNRVNKKVYKYLLSRRNRGEKQDEGNKHVVRVREEKK